MTSFSTVRPHNVCCTLYVHTYPYQMRARVPFLSVRIKIVSTTADHLELSNSKTLKLKCKRHTNPYTQALQGPQRSALWVFHCSQVQKAKHQRAAQLLMSDVAALSCACNGFHCIYIGCSSVWIYINSLPSHWTIPARNTHRLHNMGARAHTHKHISYKITESNRYHHQFGYNILWCFFSFLYSAKYPVHIIWFISTQRTRKDTRLECAIKDTRVHKRTKARLL